MTLGRWHCPFPIRTAFAGHSDRKSFSALGFGVRLHFICRGHIRYGDMAGPEAQAMVESSRGKSAD